MRHGLIPNLLNSGSSPRYNCRDAVWWWLQSLQEYCQLVPHGTDILQVPIRKLFFSDEADHDPAHSNRMTVAELVQEALQRHAGGINFRERGAGPNLDKDMTPPGFNVSVAVDAATGFVCGGNQWNCGTWMDKVGESSLAGNHGTPATPRSVTMVTLHTAPLHCLVVQGWLCSGAGWSLLLHHQLAGQAPSPGTLSLWWCNHEQ